MSTYGFKDNKCKREVYTKEEIDNKVLDRSNIVVLHGIKQLKVATTTGQYTQTLWSIPYPEGFNKNNTIVLAYQGTTYDVENSTIGAYGESPSISGASFRSTFPRTVNLQNDVISLEAFNANEIERTYYYKLVLMKYEALDSEYTLGDVNGDGEITEEDGDLVLDYTTGAAALTEQQIKAADIDKNGTPDALDAAKIKRYAVGELDSLE